MVASNSPFESMSACFCARSASDSANPADTISSFCTAPQGGELAGASYSAPREACEGSAHSWAVSSQGGLNGEARDMEEGERCCDHPPHPTPPQSLASRFACAVVSLPSFFEGRACAPLGSSALGGRKGFQSLGPAWRRSGTAEMYISIEGKSRERRGGREPPAEKEELKRVAPKDTPPGRSIMKGRRLIE